MLRSAAPSSSAPIDPAGAAPRLVALQRLGVPYTEKDVAGAAEAVKGKTELDALVAYLQGLGIHVK